MPKVVIQEGAQYEFHDGKLTIFRRLGSPFWQARIYVPGERRYLFRSLKTEDLHKAIAAAEMIFMRTMVKLDEGIPVMEMRVAKAADLYLKYSAELLDSDAFSASVHAKNIKNARNYIKPYFKDRSFSSINHGEEQIYFKWRLANAKNGTGKPAKSTLRGEITLINAIIEWAETNRHIKYGVAPKLGMPREMRNTPHGKRAYFEFEEMKAMFGLLNEWSLVASTEKERQSRDILRLLVPIMFYSGMRTNDIELLRVRDIKLYDHEGEKHVELYLRGKESTKVPPRWIVAQPECHRYLVERFLAISPLSGKPDPELLIFSKNDGSFPLFEQGFRNFLKKHKLWNDSDGKPRSLYSLRHGHAIERLLAGVPIERLATNMRTSVQAIESHYGQVRNRSFTTVLTKSGNSHVVTAGADE